MIIITGAAGFIGSCLITKLNQENFNAIVAVDRFNNPEKEKNLANKRIWERVEQDSFFDWLEKNFEEVEFIFHLGAHTDTTETDWEKLQKENITYSQQIWNACVSYQIPLVYASSAATYGDGKFGFSDQEDRIDLLRPRHAYGKSKHRFDQWALARQEKPFFWAGMKFFNVYGPNEYHKGKMASPVFNMYQQIKAKGWVELFQSDRESVAQSQLKRDFVYVKDVIEVCYYMMRYRKKSGLYNVGTGLAHSFVQVAAIIFNILEVKSDIRFIEMPENVKNHYQHITKANIDKLKKTGYNHVFTNLEVGITDYVKNYLAPARYF